MADSSATTTSTWFSNCVSGGCGAKLGPAELSAILAALPAARDPNLLIGFDSTDDAAVYRLTDELAVVSTTDFFPPMVAEPHLFGQAAAANALSDVYAMGGRPIMALNLVCFPQRTDKAILAEILQGGAAKVMEAGAVLCGGHSIYDHEPKYGLAVTGLVNPKKLWTNSGAAPGQAILLTKPLGIGLVLSAERAGLASKSEFSAASASLVRLNRYAAESLAAFPVAAATDVTGFGLAGHLTEMAGQDLTIVVNYDSLPILPGAERCAAEFLGTAGGQRNRTQLAGKIDHSALSPAQQEIIYDPQTSGGLVVSLPAQSAQKALDLIRRNDPQAALIGQTEKKEGDYSVMFV
ncbi:MAG: selenide, water dikinase SelD [Deltaproteobacteria bacterium]|jgi:selenide,water dikinase|nr:selenide, water dikinase SelD [Deltaproteobacteria bacterium]